VGPLVPKVCDICRYSSADALTTCPSCGGLLRSAAPGPGEAFSRFAGGLGAVWEQLLGSPLALVAGFVLLAGVSGVLTDRLLHGPSGPNAGQEQDSSGRIRAGMHLSEVGRILDKGPPRSPSYPRMRDYFPADEFGDGTVHYEGDGVVLEIHFVHGYVTAVEESKSSAGPGPHCCRTTFISRR
jgi:hypothetical protein